ncbi:MAG TPA: AraC family transcriptional regulator [Tepidisphaeraceae bacterium]|jgi:AraC-like DNA-binding protein
MPHSSAPSNFSCYLPTNNLSDPWGIAVSAIGHTHVAPGTPYPPGAHPLDHRFTWERGRTLHDYQLVYITDGAGTFESPAGRKQKITAGTIFLLFPNTWHRYQPNSDTGWVEHWIELKGSTIDSLRASNIISPRHPLLRVGIQMDILDLFHECRSLIQSMPTGYQPLLAILGLQILTRAIFFAANAQATPSPADTHIKRAQTLIASAIDRPLKMRQIAKQVSMGYSYFRRSFRQRTGLSPKQYHLQLRMRKAQNLLASTSLSVKEIADSLGFDTPFHLSAAFKSRLGISPTAWRARLAVPVGKKTGRS